MSLIHVTLPFTDLCCCCYIWCGFFLFAFLNIIFAEFKWVFNRENGVYNWIFEVYRRTKIPNVCLNQIVKERNSIIFQLYFVRHIHTFNPIHLFYSVSSLVSKENQLASSAVNNSCSCQSKKYNKYQNTLRTKNQIEFCFLLLFIMKVCLSLTFVPQFLLIEGNDV